MKRRRVTDGDGVADYIAAMLEQLEAMARAGGLEATAHYLRMAHAEGETQALISRRLASAVAAD
jgi:hypothetical protein